MSRNWNSTKITASIPETLSDAGKAYPPSCRKAIVLNLDGVIRLGRGHGRTVLRMESGPGTPKRP